MKDDVISKKFMRRIMLYSLSKTGGNTDQCMLIYHFNIHIMWNKFCELFVPFLNP